MIGFVAIFWAALAKKGEQSGLSAKKPNTEKVARSEEYNSVAPSDAPPRPKPASFPIRQFTYKVDRA